jgi:hypothetical protein
MFMKLGETLSEKMRALLTGHGVKARGFVDVYLIRKQCGIAP